MVPNCGISWTRNDKTGLTCTIPALNTKSSDRVKSLKESSFHTRGPKLFNTLPFYIRDTTGCSLNVFKNKLDKYLSIFPDTPLSQKYHPFPRDNISGLPSNSMIDWTRYFQISTRSMKSIEDLEDNITNSDKYLEIKNSDWRHILPVHPPAEIARQNNV